MSQNEDESSGDEPVERWVQGAAGGFLWMEHASYVALGLLLSLTALIAIAATCAMLWQSLPGWMSDETTLKVIDRLLFVLMIIEILHTVRASMRTGLTCEPFIVVGLIASIRRVLVITLRSSQTTKQNEMSDGAEKLFHASMEELLVLALLITVMIGAIYVLHQMRSRAEK